MTAARAIDVDRLRRAMLRVLAPDLVARMFDEAAIDTRTSRVFTEAEIEAAAQRQEERRKLRGR
jgi:hypothetical protein